MAEQKVWLVTGASSGLGLAIALSALRAGHKVIACARTPDKAASDHPEVVQNGGSWLRLDVTNANVQQVVEDAIRREGHMDVVVNNAGYALQGPIEDLSEEQMQAQMDVTFYGAVRVLKAVLPSMRSHRSGTVVNMSSIFGFRPAGEAQVYSAAKFALEGLSESLALSLEPFNIRVVILEPGVFRSNLGGASRFPDRGLSKDYQETMSPWMDFVKAAGENPKMYMKGDPEKLGDRTVEFVDGTGWAESLRGKKPLRLFLGQDATALWKQRLEALKENYESVEEVALTTNSDM